MGAVPPDPEEALRVEAQIQPALRLLDGLVSPTSAVLGRSPHPNLLALREHLTARPAFAAADPVG